jgi:hypothetical protein
MTLLELRYLLLWFVLISLIDHGALIDCIDESIVTLYHHTRQIILDEH